MEKNEQPKIIRMYNFLNYRYDLRVNMVTQKIECKKKSGEGVFKPINEDDLMFQLYEVGFTGFEKEFRTLFKSSKIQRFDPFLTYFQSLSQWQEGDPDYIDILSDFVKTDDQDWWRTMFKKHLVRTVEQAIGGTEFNKQCLTLVGRQNDGKTRFLDFLVPSALSEYSKKGFTFGSKEGLFSLAQNFLINLDELASFEKKELNNEFKAVLSESLIRYTPKFANYETSVLRRASFFASTNQMEFLTDETGNVRWVPFVIKSIEHDYGGSKGYSKNVNIDDVWSQAYTLYKMDYKSQLSPEETEIQEVRNKKFIRITDEMDVIGRFFQKADKNDLDAEFMQPTEVMEFLRFKTSVKLYSNQIGKALSSLGFTKVSHYKPETGSVKGYFVKKVL